MVLLSIKVIDFDCGGNSHQESGEPGESAYSVGDTPTKGYKTNKAKDNRFDKDGFHDVIVLVDVSRFLSPESKQILPEEAAVSVLEVVTRKKTFRRGQDCIPVAPEPLCGLPGGIATGKSKDWFFWG